ncbi:MAG: metal-dependent transcriptional regulator [Candidatus Thermoplasmatota archaeon]|nr:metal-dependent transcriptional regulator [Candidatus Thermoplasmatota archaeon]MBS3789422.1 metal-dependent transcriptional regulator [Candidatus Thermoplasmatota archaeon]
MLGKREEEYIEAIYDVIQEKGYAKVKDISEKLGVGLSSVTEMFQKLDNKDYIDYEKYSGVTLTDKGEEKAIELSETHKVLKDFLIILGMDEELADEDACKIEHEVRRETMERLTKFVDFIQSHERPLWLKRFKKYYETGEMEECPKTLKDKNE